MVLRTLQERPRRKRTADQTRARPVVASRHQALDPAPQAAVVDAVLIGVITIEEVCRRYDLTVKEFLSWQNLMNMHGPPGLRTIRLHGYRHSPPKQLRERGVVTAAVNEFWRSQ